MKQKPIRIFWSGLSQRFYASRAYKQLGPGIVEITGEKFDVTDDIAAIVLQYQVKFKPLQSPARASESTPSPSPDGGK